VRPASSVAVVSGVVLLAVLCACTGSGASTEHAVLSVRPSSALVDAPLRIALHGLKAGQRVTITARAISAPGPGTPARPESSTATFHATSSGTLDTAKAKPSAGSYTGLEAMGLFETLHPADAASYVDHLPGAGQQVTLTATAAGKTLARTTVVRHPMAPGVRSTTFTTGQTGFDGEMFTPPASSGRHPAVLHFGGSEGGNVGTLPAALLASHGYPALSIAYFKAPGLPASLSQIPLEYFANALRWLAQQPGVDPHRLVVYGVSRGSEAAMLLGAHYPSLVSGVIALVPSNVAVPAFPSLNGPAWTLHGRPLPYQAQLGPAVLTPHAAIPVEKIRGPLLLDCGGVDAVWPSCPMATAIIDRRKAHHVPYRDRLLTFPDGGHGVGAVWPYVAFGETADTAGGSLFANARARAAAWPQILDYLHQLTN
jgi:dienelactone hydrolase